VLRNIVFVISSSDASQVRMPELLRSDCRAWNLIDPRFNINDLVGVQSIRSIDINLLLPEEFENNKRTAAVALIASVALTCRTPTVETVFVQKEMCCLPAASFYHCDMSSIPAPHTLSPTTQDKSPSITRLSHNPS
jgi:hypothetical protein